MESARLHSQPMKRSDSRRFSSARESHNNLSSFCNSSIREDVDYIPATPPPRMNHHLFGDLIQTSIQPDDIRHPQRQGFEDMIPQAQLSDNFLQPQHSQFAESYRGLYHERFPPVRAPPPDSSSPWFPIKSHVTPFQNSLHTPRRTTTTDLAADENPLCIRTVLYKLWRHEMKIEEAMNTILDLIETSRGGAKNDHHYSLAWDMISHPMHGSYSKDSAYSSHFERVDDREDRGDHRQRNEAHPGENETSSEPDGDFESDEEDGQDEKVEEERPESDVRDGQPYEWEALLLAASQKRDSQHFQPSSAPPPTVACPPHEELVRTPRSIPSLDTQSPSEPSTPTGTDTSEVNLAAGVVLNHRTQCALASLTLALRRFIDLRLGVRQRAGENNHCTSRRCMQEEQARSEVPTNVTGQSTSGSFKRQRQMNDDDDDPERPPGDNPRLKRQKPEAGDKLKIACPFMKNSPTEFSTWRTCVGPGFDGMNRMKEHLKRRHFKENSCQRCGDCFQSSKALQEHLRLPIPCLLKDTPVERGFLTSPQWDEITHKRSRCPPEERWKEMYLILFPDTPPDSIPSPYFETSDVANPFAAMFDPEEYEVYLKRHLPSRVLMRLQQDLAVFSEAMKAKLAVIVQEESSETLKAYVRQKTEDKTEPLSEPVNPPPELPMLEEDFLSTINMFGDEELFGFDFLNAEGDCQAGTGKSKRPADSGYGSLG